MKLPSDKLVWGLVRISLGWIFLWAFLDKTFGLGFATLPERAWLAGGSPTAGFLTNATKGPFAELFKAMAGNPFVDWLFMIGLLCIGAALLLGIGVRIACYAGTLMLVLMYFAGFIPPENNPVIDDHVIYALVLIGLSLSPAGSWLGFGTGWSKTKLVKKYPMLK